MSKYPLRLVTDEPRTYLAELQDLAKLEPGWLDGQFGCPIDMDMDKTVQICEALEPHLGRPAIFPHPDGHVQLEFPCGIELEVH